MGLPITLFTFENVNVVWYYGQKEDGLTVGWYILMHIHNSIIGNPGGLNTSALGIEAAIVGILVKYNFFNFGRLQLVRI